MKKRISETAAETATMATDDATSISESIATKEELPESGGQSKRNEDHDRRTTTSTSVICWVPIILLGFCIPGLYWVPCSRVGFSQNNVEKVMHEVPSYNFNMALNILNVYGLFDCIDYLRSIGAHDNSFIITHVNNPSWCNINNLI